ncbi:hypothetical protein NQ318_014392, partial [Aromia moschata]
MADVESLSSTVLPSLYEYYTAGGIGAGLSDDGLNFKLNNKTITIYSGALHYFRVPGEYWRDRLRKLRAAGLNAVETYVPWNLHEPTDGAYDFGRGGSDFEDFLDIVKFITIAKQEDLFVILRPGPYICAEWEFGGLPSWLLRSDGMKVRTSDEIYINFVERYFKKLLELVAPLQFTKGGAIIAVQIENEYGNTKDGDNPIDTAYLQKLKDILVENGMVELFFTSDTPSNGFSGTLPGVLATANFQEEPVFELSLLKQFQPNKPLMVMEYWTGWFDHWAEKHHTRTAQQFGKVLEEILNFNGSVNMYMFHGGSNWGFLNGANIKGLFTDNEGYQPDISSYDYDAPLSEAASHDAIKVRQPALPKLVERVAYPTVSIIGELAIKDLAEQIEVFSSNKPISMEMLPINNNSGQSYGYLIYRKSNVDITENAVLKIEGRVCDTVLVLINGELVSKILKEQGDLDGFGYWRLKDSTLNLGPQGYKGATLELLVENWGRVNYGKLYQFKQHKGLWQGDILINDVILSNWQVIPLEFKRSQIKGLKGWKSPTNTAGPKLYRSVLTVDEPRDTYLDMRGWIKGFVVVNDFVLSRYLALGPQQTAYLPAPFLKKGDNDILVFEHFLQPGNVKFVTDPIFELTHLHINKKRVKYLHDVVKHEFWDFKVGGPKAQAKIRKNCSLIMNLFYVGVACAVVVIVPVAAFPLVRLPGKKPLPYVILVSFDTDLSPLYQILYALMTWDIVVSVFGNLFNDSFYFYAAQHLIVQLELLKDLIRNISEGIMDESSDLDRFDSKYFQKEVMERLKICAQHHWKLLKYGNDVAQFYRLMLAPQLFMTFFLLVLNGYILMSA